MLPGVTAISRAPLSAGGFVIAATPGGKAASTVGSSVFLFMVFAFSSLFVDRLILHAHPTDKPGAAKKVMGCP